MTIGGELVEGLVVSEVKRLLADITETAGTDTVADAVADAAAELERAQAALDAAIRAFASLEAEPAAVERLQQLRDARDAARDRYQDSLQSRDATRLAVSVGDWEKLSLEGQRALIQAVIERVIVHPGRGADRVTIEPRG